MISVVIPMFNEAAVIADAIRAVEGYFFDRPHWTAEIIVVDDGSTDDSAAIVERLILKNASIRIVRNETNCGKGIAVKKGVMASSGEYVLFMDADLSTPIDQFEMLWRRAVDHDIVIASRGLPDSKILQRQSWLKERAARLGNGAVRLCLGLPYRDTQCGFKLFSAQAKYLFAFQTIARWGFDMELLYVARKHNLRIAEMPVVWRNDPTTAVKAGDYMVVLGDIFRILYNDRRGAYR